MYAQPQEKYIPKNNNIYVNMTLYKYKPSLEEIAIDLLRKHIQKIIDEQSDKIISKLDIKNGGKFIITRIDGNEIFLRDFNISFTKICERIILKDIRYSYRSKHKKLENSIFYPIFENEHYNSLLIVADIIPSNNKCCFL